ncbi:conserved hypothetical protein [Candida dubliniensis CD36]|uniref:Uncharacterized protein n=1 Tax=Candida dubliniensis (strain CD36 / ATCC MYA-646 / CBS 7987 / NCPF 3949 / NRRL Y-17841) TaxID=573826 RepID=B9W9U7_CANDC|nr:conserved hypothetical protein [Candida dubliniensis CD36]CAX45584.1 conserved hypothetical protein [Candida dubliniensis CD36]
MVVVSFVVNRIPFSRHIPIIKNFTTASTTTTTTNLSESETEDEDEVGSSSEEEEIKPIVVTTTKDKVHSKLLANRNNCYSSSKQQETDNNNNKENDFDYDANIFDSPKKQSHLGSVDGSSTLSVSERLARRKSRKLKNNILLPPPRFGLSATNMSNSSSSLSSSSSATAITSRNDSKFVETLTHDYYDTTTTTNTTTPTPTPPTIDIDKDYRMKQYLTDQNNKFDQLITKNLDIVLNGDITKDPNEKILQLIYENKSSILSYIYKTGKTQLSSRLPYIPYFNPKTSTNETNDDIFSDSSPTLLGSSSSSSPFMDQIEGNVDTMDLIEIEELISLLDNNEQKIDYFINSLNDNTKQLLKRRLEKDVDSKSEAIKNLIIISCRITFKIIRRIQDIFNHRNMDTFIEYVLKIMVYLDSKLDEETKKKIK